MRPLVFAALWTLLAAPALAAPSGQYNIVCPIAAMGSAQAGGATVARGYILSLDLDGQKGCERAPGACKTEALSVEGDVATLPLADGGAARFDAATDRLAVTGENAGEGQCRRAPFQALPEN